MLFPCPISGCSEKHSEFLKTFNSPLPGRFFTFVFDFCPKRGKTRFNRHSCRLKMRSLLFVQKLIISPVTVAPGFLIQHIGIQSNSLIRTHIQTSSPDFPSWYKIRMWSCKKISTKKLSTILYS